MPSLQKSLEYLQFIVAKIVAKMIQGVSEKKYGVVYFRYFKNGKIQQCNIFRHDKHNFYLVVC